MRPSRHLILSQSGGLVHEFWRAHNGEYLLEDNATKYLYLRCLFRALRHKSVDSEVKIHAFCVMSNHAHIVARYKSESKKLSDFMRVAHCVFGQVFNKINKRQGPVAYDRPKTPLVQERVKNMMRVHFYVEANPLRAKMVRDLRFCKFSSYAYYAWGVVNEFTSKLTEPDWYLNLGNTAKLRQSRYRSLFNKYLDQTMGRLKELTSCRYIGSEEWCEEKESDYTAAVRAMRLSKKQGPPPDPVD